MRFTPTRSSFWVWTFALLVVSAQGALAQGSIISGKVTSESGNLIEVANVYITEMNISVPTNAQGAFTINIPAERVRGQSVTLRARAIGYTSQGTPITVSAGLQSHDFVLKRDVNRLQEVVITGTTGATEIKKTAFSITAVDQSDMPVPSTNALAQLQGKVPGMQLVQPSGRPGTAPAVILRGAKSLDASGRSQGPLFIVDGVIVTNGSQDLNPTDIESIEVVKGAAASSLYGSRAANGVIQITTKNGKNAAPGVRFNARSEYGFSDVQGAYPFSKNTMLLMDETMTRFCVKQTGQPQCARTVDFEEEAFRINDQGPEYALAPRSFERDYGIGAAASKPELKGLFQINQWPKSYDPIAQTTTSGKFLNSNVDMTGRFGNTSYFTSVSNLSEEGSVKFLQGYTRSGGRVNVDQQVGDNWTMAVSSFYSRSTQGGSGSWFRLTRVPAGVNLLRTDSKNRLFIRSNPLAQGSQNENALYFNQNTLDRTKSDRFLGSLTTKYTPFAWMDLDANVSMDRSRYNQFYMQDRGYRTTNANPTTNNGYLYNEAGDGASYNMSLNGVARHNFSDDLATRVQARYTYEREDGFENDGSGRTLALPGLRSADAITTNFGLASDQSSVRAVGSSIGGNVEYKERYIFDGLYRYDGSSLFGSEQRWHGYYRGSFAWRASEEPFWPLHDLVNDFKLRASVGTAGGRPRFSAQYETFSLGAGGLVSAANLGNKQLKPEYSTETEYGIDAEILNKYGFTMNYARDITKDQIILVPPPVSSGFQNQWKNAGTLDGKTWELALNVPLITNRNVVWSSRIGWDRTRTFITELGVPAFYQSVESNNFRYAVGEQIGNIYGKKFIRNCSELPAAFASQCGAGKEFQTNDEGWVVWVGAGNTPSEGVTKNLWQATRAGCLNGTGGTIGVTGEVDCTKAGGTVNNPWGQPEMHWGMPIATRDSTGSETLNLLGNTLPDWRLTFSQNFQWKKVNVYALVDHSHGNEIFNEEIHWSLGDFMVNDEDQTGKSVANAKPIGYYWRATRPENTAGVGGFYDVLGANNKTVQSGQYTKIREINVSYQLGRIRGIAGDWNASLIGRNLYTFTDFKGWDPEVGTSGGNLNSSAIGAIASYQYPPRRTFTFSIGSRF